MLSLSTSFSQYVKDKNPIENCPLVVLCGRKTYQIHEKFTVQIKAPVHQYCIVSLITIIIFNWGKKCSSLKYILNVCISH